MISQLLLEEILNGEKKAEDYYQLYGKENLDKALEEMKKENEEILIEYPIEKIQKSIKQKRTASSSRFDFHTITYWAPGFAAAAVLACIFVGPNLKNRISTFSEASKNTSGITYDISEETIPSPIRIKGQENPMSLKLYKKKGNTAEILSDKALAKEGETIQISYVPGTNKYGYIFSIDGNGNLTNHFPESGFKSKKLMLNASETLLDYSYTLDNAPDFESFIFVASDKPFEMTSIEEINQDFNKEFIENRSFVPTGCQVSVFTLKKDNQ